MLPQILLGEFHKTLYMHHAALRSELHSTSGLSDFRWWIADLYRVLATVFGINGSCYHSPCQPPVVPLNRTRDMCGWRHHIPHVPREGHQEWVPELPDAAPPPHLFFPSGFTLLNSHTCLGPASSICIFIPLLLQTRWLKLPPIIPYVTYWVFSFKKIHVCPPSF